MGFPLPGRVHRWGWIGVDLFFVLSGYLIGGQLLAELARNNRLNLSRFYARRTLRILPAYFVILAIYFLLALWREYPDMAQSLWKFLFSLQNIALHGGTAFSHAWSLAVEDQFYLALPFILLVVFWRPRGAIILSCVILLGGVLLRAFLASQNATDTGVSFRGFQAWIYYPTWTRLDPLVFGVMIAAIEKFRPRLWQRLTESAIWLWLPAFALIVYALWLGESDHINFTACVWQFPLLATGMAAAADLRHQPAPAITSRCDSRRSVHRQHRLQCVSGTKTRDPRCRANSAGRKILILNPLPHLSAWKFAFMPPRRFSFSRWSALSCSCVTASPLVHLALLRDPGSARVSLLVGKPGRRFASVAAAARRNINLESRRPQRSVSTDLRSWFHGFRLNLIPACRGDDFPKQKLVAIWRRVVNHRAKFPCRATSYDNSIRNRARRSDRRAWHWKDTSCHLAVGRLTGVR